MDGTTTNTTTKKSTTNKKGVVVFFMKEDTSKKNNANIYYKENGNQNNSDEDWQTSTTTATNTNADDTASSHTGISSEDINNSNHRPTTTPIRARRRRQTRRSGGGGDGDPEAGFVGDDDDDDEDDVGMIVGGMDRGVAENFGEFAEDVMPLPHLRRSFHHDCRHLPGAFHESLGGDYEAAAVVDHHHRYPPNYATLVGLSSNHDDQGASSSLPRYRAPPTEPTNTNALQDPANSGLVEANPIEEENDLENPPRQTAIAVNGDNNLVRRRSYCHSSDNDPDGSTSQKDTCCCTNKVRRQVGPVLVLLLPLFFIVAVALGVSSTKHTDNGTGIHGTTTNLGASGYDHQEHNEEENESSTLEVLDPPVAVAEMTTEERILSLLPSYTVDAIFATDRPTEEQEEDDEDVPQVVVVADDTPQAKAFQWLLKDPFLETYKDWRIIQRFALVTLFHSTGGGGGDNDDDQSSSSSWFNTTHWLSYEVHECDWYMANFVQTMPLDSGSIGAQKAVQKLLPPKVKTLFRRTQPQEKDKLMHLWLHNNGLKGTIPPEVYLLTDLVTMDMGSNLHLQGSIDSSIGNLQDLQVLLLLSNSLTGTLPTEVGSLTNLVYFFLMWNGLTGTIPTEIGNLQQLISIQGQHNRFSGTIPSEIGWMTNLWDIQFGQNKYIEGSIPTQIGLLSNYLGGFWFADNSLTGSLPSELGLLTSCRYLDLGQNNFSGTIPSEIVGMSSSPLMEDWFKYGDRAYEVIDKLFVTNNGTKNMILPYVRGGGGGSETGVISLSDNPNLIGTLPTQFGTMSHLQRLYLHRTGLTGTIPSQAANIPNLLWLTVYDVPTMDTSILSEEVCSMNSNQIFQASCGDHNDISTNNSSSNSTATSSINDTSLLLDCSSCQSCFCFN